MVTHIPFTCCPPPSFFLCWGIKAGRRLGAWSVLAMAARASALWRAGEAGQPATPGLSCGDGSPGDGRQVKGGVTGRKGSPSLHAARAPHVTYSSGKPVAGVLSLASGWGGGNAFPPWGPWKPGSSWGRACSVASAMSDSCNLVDCSPFRLHRPWDSPGKSTGVGCHFLLWVTFPTQGSNLHLLGLLHW